MRKSILFSTLITFLFSFSYNNHLLSHSGLSFSKNATNENVTSDLSSSTLVPCNTPTGLHTTYITETAAMFNWNDVPEAWDYSVQIRLPNGTWSFIPGSPVTNSPATVFNLSPGTTYEWRVRSNCGYGNVSYWSYPVSFTTLGSVTCEAPGWLGTFNITQTTATWDWSPVSGAISYSVQWRYPGGSWNNLGGGPWYNSILNVGGLIPGTTYEWRVRSNCANWISSDWSVAESFTTLGNTCYTPSGTHTTYITQNAAMFNWSPVPGAQSYSVQIRIPGGAWSFIAGSPFFNSPASVFNLNPGTTYEWRVRANCGYGNCSDWSYPVSFTTLGSVTCDAPNWLETFNITQTTATWDWSPVSGAVSYSVQWRYAGGTWNNLPGGPWYNTILNVGNLQPGTAYEWRVRSNCSNGMSSEWSVGSSFTTLISSCTVPAGLHTTNITETSATFNWSPVSGAQSYSVQIRQPGGNWSYLPGSPFFGNSVTASWLIPGTTYEWRIRANCGYGNHSYWSSPVSFTTLGSVTCYAPSWLGTINITQTSATLDWSSVSGALSYNLQWRFPNGAWNDIPGGPWTNTWFDLTGLQPGTTYEWRVQSNCMNGVTSPWSYSVFFTTLGAYCNTPTGMYTSYITETAAMFNWSPVSGAENYSVQIRLPNGNWEFIPGNPFQSSPATITGLTPGTTYEWRVRANCANGNSSNWSSSIVFTTDGSSACEAPSWLETTNITQTTATWDWSPVNGAVSYSVQWRYAGGTWYNLAGGPWYNTILNVGGLLPGTAYEWRVRSNCSNWQTSPWSAPSAFTTLSSSCSVPGGMYTSYITETAAMFNWAPSSGANSYSIQIRVPGGMWSYIPGSPFYNSPATINGLNPGTTYEWRIRANCNNGGESYWSSPVSFTTNGSNFAENDNCTSANWLSVNSTCSNTVGSNIGATASMPPPVGGCYSSNYKDVWFKFTMPNVSNPLVTVRTTAGSLADAVMELYTGSSCSNLSYLTCEDDNNNGNGSDMPVISLMGGPGSTVWVRIWGYGGSTGTFNICVFDYQSNSINVADNGIVVPFEGEQLAPVELTPELEMAENKESIQSVVSVSPNPASNMIRVTYTQTSESIVTDLVLTDMSGKIVLKNAYQSKGDLEFNEQVDVSAAVPGLYIMQVVTTSGILTEKVMIAR